MNNNSNVDQLAFHVLYLTWTLFLNIAGEQTVISITSEEANSIIKLQRERNTGKNSVKYGGDGDWNIYYTFD